MRSLKSKRPVLFSKWKKMNLVLAARRASEPLAGVENVHATFSHWVSQSLGPTLYTTDGFASVPLFFGMGNYFCTKQQLKMQYDVEGKYEGRASFYPIFSLKVSFYFPILTIIVLLFFSPRTSKSSLGTDNVAQLESGARRKDSENPFLTRWPSISN